jgi:hypothetical protein
VDDLGQRLSTLLHQRTPEPPRPITADQIRKLADNSPTQSAIRRWPTPLLAVGAVVVVAATATSVALINSGGGPSTPAVQPRPTSSRPAPTATSTAPTSSAAPTSTPIAMGPVATCATAQLRLSHGPSDGAAGTTRTEFQLTNTGTGDCTMKGFPGVALLDDSGNIVGSPAARTGAAGPTVTLKPSGHATFTVAINNATQTGCDVPRPSTQIQVYPPDQTTTLKLVFPSAACTITVTTTTAGS